MNRIRLHLMTASLLIFVSGVTSAHDPVFGLGPHTLFKGGIETHIGFDQSKANTNKAMESSLEVAYGITGNWTARVEIPYVDRNIGPSGISDMRIATKYRFWRRDDLGLQESSTAFLKIKPDTASNGRGNGASDSILGIAYGYESRKWYRWASVRYRFNGEALGNVSRGDQYLVDLVTGIRFKPSAYKEADWVWMLELNGEKTKNSQLNGVALANSGGTEWFLSPGLMWTLRNFAIKTGMQFPVASNLNGIQAESDYRAKLEFEWHL